MNLERREAASAAPRERLEFLQHAFRKFARLDDNQLTGAGGFVRGT